MADVNDDVREILRNLPGNSHWEGSFWERLAEHCVWDVDAFWMLHRSLVRLACAAAGAHMDRNMALVIARLQGRVLGLLAAHHDVNDVFRIRNLDADLLRGMVERFEHAVLGFFSGEALPESSYDVRNPLIVKI